MRFRSTLLAGLSVLVLLTAAPFASAQEDSPDPLVDAVRDVLHGADAATRESGRQALRAQPEAAVRLLLQALEELAAARKPPVAFATVEAAPPAAAPAAEDDAVVRIYDVRDLVERAGSAERIAGRLRDVVGSDEAVTLQGDGIVIVRTAPLLQDDVAHVLAALRQDQSELVSIEARVVEAPLTAALGRAASASRPGDVIALDDPAAAVAGWLAAGDAKVTTAPVLSCFPGQRASVQAGKQISFVADFDVEVAQSPTSPIVDPIIDTVFEGVDLALLPALPNAGRVLLDVRATATDVELESFGSTLGVLAEHVEIQIPAVFRTEVHRSIDVPDGGTVLVRIGDDRDARRFVLLHVARERLVDDD